MSLIDDTCDNCGSRFDPMGDPLLTRHHEIGPWAVFCARCEDAKTNPRTLLTALVAEVEKVGHRGTCRIQPCDCWWKHGLYDAVNAATDYLETQP